MAILTTAIIRFFLSVVKKYIYVVVTIFISLVKDHQFSDVSKYNHELRTQLYSLFHFRTDDRSWWSTFVKSVAGIVAGIKAQSSFCEK